MGVPDLHRHATRGPAVLAQQSLLQQLPFEWRAAGAISAARRRGWNVSGVQQALGPAVQSWRPYRRLLRSERECRGRNRSRGWGSITVDNIEGSAGRLGLPHMACPWIRGWEEPRMARPKRHCLVELDARKGEALFMEHCTNCHGEDGQGVAIGDKKPGPLWGPDSWNDGAGAARVYTLAGIIRYSMPYLNPGSLTDEEAQQLAAFINSKPRPSYPFKQQDYRTEKLPVDSVYYTRP